MRAPHACRAITEEEGAGVLRDRLEHVEAVLAIVARAYDDQRVFDELLEQAEHLARGELPARLGDRLDRREGRAATEVAEQRE